MMTNAPAESLGRIFCKRYRGPDLGNHTHRGNLRDDPNTS
jgi:hypothetical protein